MKMGPHWPTRASSAWHKSAVAAARDIAKPKRAINAIHYFANGSVVETKIMCMHTALDHIY
jgi:hypothetical protein